MFMPSAQVDTQTNPMEQLMVPKRGSMTHPRIQVFDHPIGLCYGTGGVFRTSI